MNSPSLLIPDLLPRASGTSRAGFSGSRDPEFFLS